MIAIHPAGDRHQVGVTIMAMVNDRHPHHDDEVVIMITITHRLGDKVVMITIQGHHQDHHDRRGEETDIKKSSILYQLIIEYNRWKYDSTVFSFEF